MPSLDALVPAPASSVPRLDAQKVGTATGLSVSAPAGRPRAWVAGVALVAVMAGVGVGLILVSRTASKRADSLATMMPSVAASAPSVDLTPIAPLASIRASHGGRAPVAPGARAPGQDLRRASRSATANDPTSAALRRTSAVAATGRRGTQDSDGAAAGDT